MDVLSGQVLQEFGVKAKRIVKEKSYYICGTDKGLRVVRKASENRDRIMFQHEIKEHLYHAGFQNTDRYCLTVKKQPYFEYLDEVYVMTELHGLRELNFSNNEEFKRGIKATAAMHTAASNINFGGRIFYGEQNWTEEFKKNIADLQNFKKRVQSQKRLSDFDVIFLKNYDYYLKQIKASVQGLEKTRLLQYTAFAQENKNICHNLLKEENILTDQCNTYIVGFSQAAVGYSLPDLAGLIQRYVKTAPQRPLSAQEIICTYHKYKPLSADEVEILYHLLKYPDKFLRICCQYYSKKRTWTPNAIINRMEKIIEDRDRYERVVESIMR